MAELRSAIFIDQLQPQTMCYLGTWIRGRLPRSGMAAAVIEVAPGLDIEGLTDVALKHTRLEAGILVVERQFGYLEFHSRDPRTILAFGAAVGVLRVSVNAPGSTGGSGLDTNLAPTMTVGTGFFGRSSLTENLQPKHLTQWTRLAYNADPAEPFGDFGGLEPWSVRAEPAPVAAPPPRAEGDLTRDDLRRLILDELRELVK